MKRQCTIFKSSIEYNCDLNRHICVDLENSDELYSIINGKEKKFKKIAQWILTNRNMYYDCYAKEKVDKNTGNISAMKFFDKDNTRIYCQEMRAGDGVFYIICCVMLLRKKSQKNDRKIIDLIKRIASYEYEIV